MTETRDEYRTEACGKMNHTCQTCGNAGFDGLCTAPKICICYNQWVPRQNPMDNTTVQELRNQIAKLIFEKEQLKDELTALKESKRWIPISEQRPPEDESRYIARKFRGETYWAWLPVEPGEAQ